MGKLTTSIAMALFLGAPTLAAASGSHFVSTDGVVYAASINNSGTVLRNKRETIYLGRSCDAVIPGVGKGWWSWNARGTFVKVGRYVVMFSDVSDLSPARCLS